jgi:hypothetical protein
MYSIKMKMMKSYKFFKSLKFVFLAFIFQSSLCEPPVDCTDPKCGNSPISLNLVATLSDSSTVFRVGDTLRFNLKIPDTLVTNMGTYYLGYIQNAVFSLHYVNKDRFGDSTISADFPPVIVTKGSTKGRPNYMFDNNRELELLFVLPKKSQYYIGVSSQPQRCIIVDKKGNKTLIMFSVDFNNNGNGDLYLSWLKPHQKDANAAWLTAEDNNRLGYFYFEVK